tara:strand:- start:660 stop:1151 length:492 start_codon:yes stop_codon:yes gene_type:complete
MKFRKKPVVIEATQWFKMGDHSEVVEATLSGMPVFWIETLEGGHIVTVGDYIITGVKGEHYPCKPDIFVMTYEPVGEAQPAPVQEPVAWMTQARCFVHLHEFTEAEAKLYGWTPVYTLPAAQRTWVDLTDEDKDFIAKRASVYDWHDYEVIEATEAKLKKKNT